jgi:hypothetical protein
VLLLGFLPTVPVGPASLHLLLGPGVVVVLGELLDEGVELVGQLDTACGIGVIIICF